MTKFIVQGLYARQNEEGSLASLHFAWNILERGNQRLRDFWNLFIFECILYLCKNKLFRLSRSLQLIIILQALRIWPRLVFNYIKVSSIFRNWWQTLRKSCSYYYLSQSIVNLNHFRRTSESQLQGKFVHCRFPALFSTFNLSLIVVFVYQIDMYCDLFITNNVVTFI